jgi:hypothetical protein
LHAGSGIEIDDHLIGAVEPIRPREPRMNLERAELDELNEARDADRGGISADAGRFLDVDALEPHERRVVEMFLKKTLTALAARATHDRERASLDGRQHVLCYVAIVLGELALAHTEIRIDLPRRMRKAYARDARPIRVMCRS